MRELVENSLDACESINVLPEIDITIEEMDRAALNKLIGVKSHARLDDSLFASDAPGKKAAAAAASSAAADADADDDAGDGAAGKGGGGGGKAAKGDMFYRVVVKDNGCGMKHENIPNMLGRVLSGSKYGVRQTRGKFGLGAKMALIWSKQSTGMPVEVRSSTGHQKPLSVCVDIDIQKNEPRVKVREHMPTTAGCAAPRSRCSSAATGRPTARTLCATCGRWP